MTNNPDHNTDGSPAGSLGSGESSRAIAERNAIATLRLAGYFGHVRVADVAAALYPSSDPKTAYEMARRTVKRLLDAGEVLERRNPIGGLSIVLATSGCARLRRAGFDAKPGYEISSVQGGTFLHRGLTTAYLIHRLHAGATPVGEYALMTGQVDIDPDLLKKTYKKLPDGLCISTNPTVYDPDVQVVEWVETEMSFKPADQLNRVLDLELGLGPPLAGVARSTLDRLTILCDRRSGHAERICRHAPKWMQTRREALRERDPAFDSIVFVLADVVLPLTVQGFTEISLGAELRRLGLWQPRYGYTDDAE